MKSQYFIIFFIVFEQSVGFKPNHQISRQSKSIFSNKKCMETFTPARYLTGNKNFMFDQANAGEDITPEQYFPQMEYPTNIMESSRPFFYKTGDNFAMLGPFPDDVKSSYKSIIDQNKKALEELKAKYMNDFALNAKNCLEEKMAIAPKKESIIEKLPVSIDSVDEILVDKEATNQNIPEKEPSMEDDGLTDITSSESDESNEAEDKNKIEEFESYSPATEDVAEEENIEGQIQSWESAQYDSE